MFHSVSRPSPYFFRREITPASKKYVKGTALLLALMQANEKILLKTVGQATRNCGIRVSPLIIGR